MRFSRACRFTPFSYLPTHLPTYSFPTDGHTPSTKCLLLLTHPHSSILPSIFFTCLSSNHIFTYTRPHIYPNNLPNPNITSLTSSFNSSQLPDSHTSTTSSQISLILNPNSPSSFLKHPQYFIFLLLSSLLHLLHLANHFNFPILHCGQKKEVLPCLCCCVVVAGAWCSFLVGAVRAQ